MSVDDDATSGRGCCTPPPPTEEPAGDRAPGSEPADDAKRMLGIAAAPTSGREGGDEEASGAGCSRAEEGRVVGGAVEEMAAGSVGCGAGGEEGSGEGETRGDGGGEGAGGAAGIEGGDGGWVTAGGGGAGCGRWRG